MDIHIYLHNETGGVDRKLDRIITLLNREIAMTAETQKALDDLNAAVAEQTTVEASIETLLNGLSAQIAALKVGQTDPVVIAALNDATNIVKATVARAQAAVVANTPAAD